MDPWTLGAWDHCNGTAQALVPFIVYGRSKQWVLWSSRPCVRLQGAGVCFVCWGSSTQRAVISVGCALFLRKHAAQLTCWQYVSAVVTSSRRLSSTSIGRRGRWHARVGTVHVIDRAEAGFEHLGGISFFQFPKLPKAYSCAYPFGKSRRV